MSDVVEIDLSRFDADGGRGASTVRDLYSHEVLVKARGLLEEGDAVISVDHEDLRQPVDLWIVNGSRTYEVRRQALEGAALPWLTCTCPNGDARGARPSCYHTAAVMALITGDELSDVTA